jgi:hypothetical protein
MLLARNMAPDRLKAIGYVEQAIVVLEEHGSADDNGDEVKTTPSPPWPPKALGPVIYCSIAYPAKRYIRWTSVIGFSRLHIIRGLSAFSTALLEHVARRLTTFISIPKRMLVG